MKQPKLVATYYTLAGPVYPGVVESCPFSFERRAEAAAAVGYYGIGLSGYDLSAVIDRCGRSGVRDIVRNAGLQFLEIECLTDWFADGETRAESDRMRKSWLESAMEIGADHFKIVGDLAGTGVSMQRMGDEFRLFCKQAAEVGAKVSIEIFPEANINDLVTGCALMEHAGPDNVPNGGLLVDIWHMTRPGIPYSEVASLPASYIAHVEIDDAAAEMQGSLWDDSTEHRLFPGEGSFDVPAFLRAIAQTGYDGTYGVEILSNAVRRMEPEEAARRSYATSMAQFALAANDAPAAGPPGH